jgi:outer membrane immunogenic protein
MKRSAIVTAVTALAALVVGGAAQAADMPVKAPIVRPVLYSWTGCFIGVAGGGKWGHSKHVSGDAGTLGLDIVGRYNISGGIVGVEYGCNYQTGSWVLGTESDFSWTNAKGGANNIPPFATTSVSNTREHWLSTSRLRAGFLADPNLLIYATGGLATARVEALVDATIVGAGVLSESRTRWGWTVGGGIEYALGSGWSAKLDYLYVKLNSKEYNNPPLPGFAIRSDVPVDQHVFRVGVNYKFTSCFFILLGC